MKNLQRSPRLVLASCIAIAAFLFVTALLSAQKVTTTVGGFVGDGGPATAAGLNYPRDMVQDSSGNTYVVDSFNHRIRVISPTGTIRTFAGTGISGFSGDGGLARNATLSFPNNVIFDAQGNMLIADGGNNRIRKIDASGMISTIAGTGVAGFTGDNGPALQAELNYPWDLFLDSAGNLFLSDLLNFRIRKIDTAGIITTVAGNGTEGYNGDGIPAVEAEIDLARGIAVDSHGNLFIADTANHRVRKVDSSGNIRTFAGTGEPGFRGDGLPASQAAIGNPRGLVIRRNQLLIANAGRSTIRAVNLQPPNIIETFAGSFSGYDGDGNPPHASEFDGPTGMLLVDPSHLLVADQFNARVRKLTPSSVTTLVGGFVGDNRRGTLATLTTPENIAFDAAGNYYMAEWGGNRIRKLDAGSGQITTIVGDGISGYTGDGGPAALARVWSPFGVAVDSFGNVYIADTSNAAIRKVDTAKNISTLVTDPNFGDLVSLATDSEGNVYSADDGACVIRKITPTGVISIVAGVEFECGFNGDGIPATTALLNGPYGVAVDTSVNIYIGDSVNNRVRKVSGNGRISTIAGNGTCGFSGDGGPGASAMLCSPEGLSVDVFGSVYIADYLNLRIRKLSGAGIITTFAGSGNSGYNGEDLPAASTNLDGPIAVGIDNVGTVFVLDDVQARVRKIH